LKCLETGISVVTLDATGAVSGSKRAAGPATALSVILRNHLQSELWRCPMKQSLRGPACAMFIRPACCDERRLKIRSHG
jgi:hypothetical protein